MAKAGSFRPGLVNVAAEDQRDEQRPHGRSKGQRKKRLLRDEGVRSAEPPLDEIKHELCSGILQDD